MEQRNDTIPKLELRDPRDIYSGGGDSRTHSGRAEGEPKVRLTPARATLARAQSGITLCPGRGELDAEMRNLGAKLYLSSNFCIKYSVPERLKTT